MHNQIIAEARSWIGTKFKYQGRVKKSNMDQGGCDCLGIIIKIAEQLNLYSKTGQLLYLYDQTNYEKLPNPQEIIDFCNLHFDQVSPEEMAPGDIVILSFNKKPQHLAIISDTAISDNISNAQLSIIHSFLGTRKIVEQTLTTYWKKKIHSCYRFSL